nr:DUF397 domain-containing protein [Actinomadura decatromicini]
MGLCEASWRKASRSHEDGDACVEVAPTQSPVAWKQASRSNGSGGACIEMASTTGAVGIRDSKNPAVRPS